MPPRAPPDPANQQQHGHHQEQFREIETAHGTAFELVKPPFPTLATSSSRHANAIEVQLPPLIGGALVAAFAATVADGLGNQLLTHYYLSDAGPGSGSGSGTSSSSIRVNLDRALDRLLAAFTDQLWDELFEFYRASNAQFAKQVAMLFDGPIRQLILVLNGPELSRCILERIGPGLSRRPITWSETSKGIDLSLALQLVCGFWHREYPALSPGGNPDEIARTLSGYLADGRAFRNLLASVRHTLMTPHYVQMILMESAVWDMAIKRGHTPPKDGFHVMQFAFECDVFDRLSGIDDPSRTGIGSLSALTGTAGECVVTTVCEYVDRRWPRYGRILQDCLSEALVSALLASRQGQAYEGMSVWDGSGQQALLYPGLRLIHVEAEAGVLRLSVSAWVTVLVEMLQQMAWTCAALSASPVISGLAECTLQISSWNHLDASTYVNCSLNHRPVPQSEISPGLQDRRGVSIASGFPLEGRIMR